MIISMKLHSTREEIDEVCSIVKHHGYKVHSIEGEERVVIGVVGVGDVTPCLESVEAKDQGEWHGNRGRRVRGDRGAVLGRERRADHALSGSRGESGGEAASR